MMIGIMVSDTLDLLLLLQTMGLTGMTLTCLAPHVVMDVQEMIRMTECLLSEKDDSIAVDTATTSEISSHHTHISPHLHLTIPTCLVLSSVQLHDR